MSYVSGTPAERKALQKSASIKVLIAIVLSLVGYGIGLTAAGAGAGAQPNVPLALLGSAIQLISAVPWFWGLGEYSKSKGYTPWMASITLFPCIGLLILVLLPNKWVNRPEGAYDPHTNYPR